MSKNSVKPFVKPYEGTKARFKKEGFSDNGFFLYLQIIFLAPFNKRDNQNWLILNLSPSINLNKKQNKIKPRLNYFHHILPEYLL